MVAWSSLRQRRREKTIVTKAVKAHLLEELRHLQMA